MKPIIITEDEYREHDDSYDGLCLACGEWSEGGCEPDAREYECDACGEKKVYGVAEALMMGALDVEEE